MRQCGIQAMPVPALTRGAAIVPPLVVELVGPAGAGKSTLSQALARGDQTVRAGLGLWGLPLPLLGVGAVQLFLSLSGACLGPALRSWSITSRAIRLNALHRLLGRPTEERYRVVLLDEGPVFALSWAMVFHNDSITNGCLEGWWHEAMDRWGEALHAVIYLDAPDPMLVRRIRTREKPHPMKDCADREITDFLGTFRSAFDHVIAGLAAHHGTRSLVFSTEDRSVDLVADEIRAILHDEWSARR